ncbi:hypothetical protein MTBBW1_2570003 [Desulfamplus magnetovallimortis]|uniref:Flagellin n=1 Tax=Desulfamplus magnetovallimortis TaxID=1246637 RepID=A0A1W1HEZ6_9BACT|nr:flagellin [Desulfamplus magnetovallimortis]SLM30993.1 hypothetical protein MTBBW1_2570003 [Desulfamplus magnetovallimortis]
MGICINTNTTALNCIRFMSRNTNNLRRSIERLSSGLRINKAADDASGMHIADSLRSQRMGYGQAIKNANDAISIAQIADGALQESVAIIDTIKTKCIQASSDSQTSKNRKIIQKDISALLDEFDMIAETTSFNGQKLLSGNFINKSFQVGANSGETLKISINSAESNKIGHVNTQYITPEGEGILLLDFDDGSGNQIKIESLLAYDNDVDHGIGKIADKINRRYEAMQIKAFAEVSLTHFISEGKTEEDFSINGIKIGSLTIEKNDSHGALAKAINDRTSEHGVRAISNINGSLTFESVDDRAISIKNGGDVFQKKELSTVGRLRIISRNDGRILNLNDPPLIQTTSEPLIYVERDGPINIDPELSLGDPDDKHMSQAVVKIAENYVEGEDELVFKNIGNITGSWDKGSGRLTFTGVDTVANYEAALRSVCFDNKNKSVDFQSSLNRKIAFTVTDNNREIVNKDLENDGKLTSPTAYRNIEIMERYASYENAYKLPEDYASILDVYQTSNNYYLRGELTNGDSYVAKFDSSWKQIWPASSNTPSSPSITGTVTNWFFFNDDLYAIGISAGKTFIEKHNDSDGTQAWRHEYTGNITGVKFNGTDMYLVGDDGANSFAAQIDTTTTNQWLSNITGNITDLIISGTSVHVIGDVGADSFVETLNENSGATNYRSNITGTMNDYEIIGSTLYAVGRDGTDAFIERFDSGASTWRQAPDSDTVGGNSVANRISTSGGNVYVRGSFNGTVDFDPGIDDPSTDDGDPFTTSDIENLNELTAITSPDYFTWVFKNDGDYVDAYYSAYNNSPTGTTLRTINAISDNISLPTLVTDPDHYRYRLSDFSGSHTFTPGIDDVVDETIDSNGANDIYLSKQTNDGEYEWINHIGGTGIDSISLITLDRDSFTDLSGDEDGSLFILGSFNDTVDFDPSNGVAELTNTDGNGCFFVAQYSQPYLEYLSDPVPISSNKGGKSYVWYTVSEKELSKLNDLNVSTFPDAQLSMEIADQSLIELDRIRSNIGSVHNQLESTISNLSNSMVNIARSESTIRDVDFVSESTILSKIQIYMQTGTFALSQANSYAKNALSLIEAI